MGTLFATIITQATLMAGAAVLPDKDVTATPPPIEQQASTESIQSSEEWNDSILDL